MARLLLLWGLLCLLVFAVGCTALKASLADYQACVEDPNCSVKMEKVSNSVSPVYGSVMGMVLSIVTGVWLGRKLRKKD